MYRSLEESIAGSVKSLLSRISMADGRTGGSSKVHPISITAESAAAVPVANQHEQPAVGDGEDEQQEGPGARKQALKRHAVMVILVAVVVLPVVAVTILSVATLNTRLNEYSKIDSISSTWSQMRSALSLVQVLLAERLSRCIGYVEREVDGDFEGNSLTDHPNCQSTPRNSQTAVFARTDHALQQAGIEPTSTLCDDGLSFVDRLNDVRLGEQRLCTADEDTYNALTTCLLEQVFATERADPSSAFWLDAQTLNLLLLAQDFFGIKRALGGTYFARNGFNQARAIQFSRISQTARVLFGWVRRILPNAAVLYDSIADDNRELIDELDRLEHLITNNITANGSDSSLGLAWFNNMTAYMGVIGKVASFIQNDLTRGLDVKIEQYDRQQRSSWILVAIVLSICPLMACAYVFTTRQLMKDQQKFAKELQAAIQQGKQEKLRTDQILQNMLPKSVAEKLRDNEKVVPKHYREATVFYSDIVGFTTISSRCTPLQVVNLLNELFTQFDDILDRYDAYKVETIGDAYVIVSGVPKTNQGQHSNVMASLSLEFIMMLHDFRMPHDQSRLFMRIGLHTGAVTAGVVGVKMPRYCLFGPTVSIANTMETYSAPLRITISRECAKHLHLHNPDVFTTQPRDPITTKGGEVLEGTHWLLAKEECAFEIDLDEAERIYQEDKKAEAAKLQTKTI